MISWLYKKIGEFLKDSVYAANDGIITTFAVVAGVVGASLDPLVILILGFANLFADGISMASGNYLGTKSEKDLYGRERERNRQLLLSDEKKYKKRIINFLISKGYEDGDIYSLAELILRREKFALDFIMHEEIGFVEQKEARPVKGALVTFLSFVLAGLVPLLPYIFLYGAHNAFLLASLLTGCALFIVGASRSVFTKKPWVFSGMEMFFVGGLAAVVAYGIGFGIRQII